MRTLARLLTTTLLVASTPAVCLAQSQTPEATAAPSVPSLNHAPEPDQLTYTLGASESLLFGYNGRSGVNSSTNLSGTAAFVSGSQSRPFSLLYSGGYLFGNTPGQPNSTYQNLGVSQQINTKHVIVTVGDVVSYLPNAPVFGLSGIPGVGDIGTGPIGTGGIPTSSILTDYGRRVSNTASGSADLKLTASTDLNPYAAYTIERFVDAGLDNNELDTGVSIDHRLNALNTVGAGFVYSKFSYLAPDNIDIYTDEANVQYMHVFSRRVTFNASAGPEFTHSNNPALIPTRTDFAAGLSLTYMQERTQYMLSYSRGTNNGSGVLLGGVGDNVNFTATHKFTRKLSGSFSGNYAHNSSLAQTAGLKTTAWTVFAGAQANYQFARYWSAFGSYNLEYQHTTGVFAANAFSGTAHILGFGVYFTPRPLNLHR